MDYLQLFLVFFSLVFTFWYLLHDKNNLPTNWPIVGMLPALLKNMHRINDFCVELLEKSPLTILVKGPPFANMDLLLTAEPSNVHYIMSKNFHNYPKGPKFNAIFEVLGDGIFNADSELWQYHRGMAQSFLTHPRFHQFLIQRVKQKTESSLITILEHASKQGLVLDLQDLFERFTFDTICTLVMGHDFESLSIHLPNVPFSKALDQVEEAILYRHVVPRRMWRLMGWLGVGKEKQHKKAWRVLEDFIYQCIANKRQQIEQKELPKVEDFQGDDLLTRYVMNQNDDDNNNNKFYRDTILNFFIAGRDTTSSTLSWFFYLLSKNPRVESKIRQELRSVVISNDDDFLDNNNFEQVNRKMVYLHAALCEALRLYPPVVFQAKSPVNPDLLPTGHQVGPDTQIIFNLYAMGRMEPLWGDDCHEFRPERWISEKGNINHEPSYKFLAFNAGPRTCLGKDMAFTQMKIVAMAVLQNYRIQAVQAHPVVPQTSIILRMKYGFKVKVLPSS